MSCNIKGSRCLDTAGGPGKGSAETKPEMADMGKPDADEATAPKSLAGGGRKPMTALQAKYFGKRK